MLVVPARAPRLPRVGLIALMAGWLTFLGWAIVEPGDGSFVLMRDGVLYSGLTIGSALLVLSRAVSVRAERPAWFAMGVGLLASGVGEVAAAIQATVAGDGPVAVPSPADVLFLAQYPCLYASLVLLLRNRIRRLSATAWLDGMITGSALASAVSALAFVRIAEGTGGSTPEIVVGLAYPLSDLMLLAAVGGALTILGWRADRRWWLITIGILLLVVVDTVFMMQTASGTYSDGTWIDSLWPGAALVLASTSWLPSRQLTQEARTGWSAMLTPVVCSVIAVTVLCAAAAGAEMPALAVIMAGMTLLGTTGRFAISFAEVSQLAHTRAQAMTDELTGLPNRRRLLSELTQWNARGSAADGLGLLMLDLDRFKEINDSLGHHVGDELLVQLGRRLTASAGSQALVTRLGGDEFAVLLTGLPGTRTHDLAQATAERICAELARPFALDDVTLHVQASIGIGLLPDHTDDPLQLLQRADVAMYTAKGSADRTGVYLAENDPHSRERLELLEQLRTSLRHGGLTCFYQPKLGIVSGEVEEFEALVRWHHPRRGLLAPAAFLPLAEHAGLMRELTDAVFRTALGQVKRWRSAGLRLGVAVNLSATNLLDAGLPAQIGTLLSTYGLPADSLRVEITETVVMTDSLRSRTVLQQLHELGVRIAIDDYGTGYSTLAYLQHLPVDELKIDRMFVSRLISDPKAEAIVRSTIDLAHSLNLQVVAEGVEDSTTLAALRMLGCDTSQGYLHGRPMDGESATRWLRDRSPQHLGNRDPYAAPVRQFRT